MGQAEHTLKVVVQGRKNPLAAGWNVYLDGLQWSAAQGLRLVAEIGYDSEHTQRHYRLVEEKLRKIHRRSSTR